MNDTHENSDQLEHAHHHHDAEMLPLKERVVNLVVIMLPFVALISASVYTWGWGIGWVDVLLFFGMYIITGLGITVGYHRFFTHKSFETNRWVVALLGIAGSMAVEGPLLRWVAYHRCHHQHSDHDDDPHSPHCYGGGVLGILRGLWRSHIGWVFEPKRVPIDRFVPDLNKDKLIVAIDRLFPLWVVLSMLLPAVLGGLLTLSWMGALLGFIWGGLVRVVFVHHVTWSVNSICHVWGTQPFRSHDESRNNAIVGVLALGEGWHNNHHAFPTSARHGLAWWQFDVSWIVIWAASKLGLARKVRVPSPERLAEKRHRPSAN